MSLGSNTPLIYKKIITCFQGLDQEFPSSSANIADYIFYNKGDLNTIKQLISSLSQDHITSLALRYADENYSDLSDLKLRDSIMQAFFEIMYTESFNDYDFCKRWGEVRACCFEFDLDDNSTPLWLRALVNDFECLAYKKCYSRTFIETPHLPKYATAKWFNDLLEYHGLLINDFINIVFNYDDIFEFRLLFQKKVIEDTEKNSLFSDDEFTKALVNSAEYIKLGFLEYLRTQKKHEIFESLILLLLSDSKKKVRNKSKEFIEYLSFSSIDEHLNVEFGKLKTKEKKNWLAVLDEYYLLESQALLISLKEQEDNQSVVSIITNMLTSIGEINSDNSAFDSLKVPDCKPIALTQLNCDEWVQELTQFYTEQKAKFQNDEDMADIATDFLNISDADLNDALKRVYEGKGMDFSKQYALQYSEIATHKEFDIQRLMFLYRDYDELDDFFMDWLSTHHDQCEDIRQLMPYISAEMIADWLLVYSYSTKYGEEINTYNISLWPFFIEHSQFIDMALDEENEQGYQMDRAFFILGGFPEIPNKYAKILYDYALNKKNHEGQVARNAITKSTLDKQVVIGQLQSKKKSLRLIAANWLCELKLEAAKPALEQALNKEKTDDVKEAMSYALLALGEDLNTQLSESNELCFKTMQGKAENALAKKIHKDFSDFTFKNIPALFDQENKPISTDVVQWWLRLALERKKIDLNPLFNQYYALLNHDSQVALSHFVFEEFITLYNNLASGLKMKGMLAFFIDYDSEKMNDIVSSFCQKKTDNHHAVNALLTVLGRKIDAYYLQTLQFTRSLSITDSTKSLISDQLNQIAKENQWSLMDLAEQSVPSFGLDNNHSRTITIDQRIIDMQLQTDGSIRFINEKGKALKKLPAAKTEAGKEAIQAFKQLQRSIEQQRSVLDRYYQNALCEQREWSYVSFTMLFLEHPLLSLTSQGLVWCLNNNSDNGALLLFNKNKQFVELVGESVIEPNENDHIRLAYYADFTSEQLDYVQDYFNQNDITALIDQFTQAEFKPDSQTLFKCEFNHYEGYMLESNTLNKILNTLGYVKGELNKYEDFYHYEKAIPELNININIGFSGTRVYDQSHLVAITELAVYPLDKSLAKAYKIQDLAEPLLNKILLDYQAVGQQGTYQKNWEKAANDAINAMQSDLESHFLSSLTVADKMEAMLQEAEELDKKELKGGDLLDAHFALLDKYKKNN